MGEAEEQADGEETEMKILSPPLKMGSWLITMRMKEVIKGKKHQYGKSLLRNGGGVSGLETVSIGVMGPGEGQQRDGEEAKKI